LLTFYFFDRLISLLQSKEKESGKAFGMRASGTRMVPAKLEAAVVKQTEISIGKELYTTCFSE